MACFHPLEAWQLDSGEIVFQGSAAVLSRARDLWLPCGKCIGCRLVKARSWAIRCVHESRMHAQNCFVTLTYSDKFYHPSLNYRDWQLFAKRARRKLGPFRFYMCGEYGDLNQRPHFHAIMFGISFPRDYPVADDVYGSHILDSIWGKGHAGFGDVTMESAGYVARYALKKVSGERAASHYKRVDVLTGEVVDVVPEFSHMSLKPGIGYSWFQKYYKDVYVARDRIVLPGGLEVPPPRYYDALLENVDGDLKEFKDFERYVGSARFADDCTPARLAVREKCAAAKARFLRRSL